jgi:hypothetical protein
MEVKVEEEKSKEDATKGHHAFVSANGFPLNISSSFYQCLELSGSGICPSRRGWGICPARARPSWIIRGACPLHDLMEVKVEDEKRRAGKTP